MTVAPGIGRSPEGVRSNTRPETTTSVTGIEGGTPDVDRTEPEMTCASSVVSELNTVPAMQGW